MAQTDTQNHRPNKLWTESTYDNFSDKHKDRNGFTISIYYDQGCCARN